MVTLPAVTTSTEDALIPVSSPRPSRIRRRIRLGRGEESGINASSVDVVTGGNIVMTPEDYLALLERERTAAQVERERLGGATEHREGGRSVPAP